MGASTLITDYIGRGLAAARPATPPVSAGCLALYYATDTLTVSCWDGSAWQNLAAPGGVALSGLTNATLPLNTGSLLEVSEPTGGSPAYASKKVTAANLLAAGNITLGSTAVALGSTVATLAGLTLSAPTLTGNTTLPGSGQISSAGIIGIGMTPIVGMTLAPGKSWRAYNSFTDASNGEWAQISWSSNILLIGTNKNGTGVTRGLEILCGGAVAIDYGVSTVGAWTSSSSFNAQAGIYSGGGLNGYVFISPGDPSSTGYFAWHKQDGSRLAYMGFSGTDVPLNLENGAKFVINGGATRMTPIAAPSSPATGWYLYVDSGDSNKLKAKASTGTVVTLGTP